MKVQVIDMMSPLQLAVDGAVPAIVEGLAAMVLETAAGIDDRPSALDDTALIEIRIAHYPRTVPASGADFNAARTLPFKHSLAGAAAPAYSRSSEGSCLCRLVQRCLVPARGDDQ